MGGDRLQVVGYSSIRDTSKQEPVQSAYNKVSQVWLWAKKGGSLHYEFFQIPALDFFEMRNVCKLKETKSLIEGGQSRPPPGLRKRQMA